MFLPIGRDAGCGYVAKGNGKLTASLPLWDMPVSELDIQHR